MWMAARVASLDWWPSMPFRHLETFFRNLETLIGTSHSLVLVGDCNEISDAREDCVGLVDEWKGCKSVVNWSRYSRLSDRDRLNFTDVTISTWSNHNALSRSYLHKVFIRLEDRDSESCSQFNLVDLKFVIFTVKLDRTHIQGPGYRKLNASFQARKDYRDRISELVKWHLTGTIVNK